MLTGQHQPFRGCGLAKMNHANEKAAQSQAGPDDLFNQINTTDTTILTLPLTDFPNFNAAIANHNDNKSNENTSQDEGDDGHDLILVSLPPSKSNNNYGSLTMSDLILGESVYILGETSESDIHDKSSGGEVSGSNEAAARLIVEGSSHELTRVETSNTYVVVPPARDPLFCTKEVVVDDDRTNDNGRSNKRQKIVSGSGIKDTHKLITRPARSIGLVPGEDSPSCFFLEPMRLQPGHFRSVLREALSRHVYDPFDPPTESALGYKISDLAHICRSSQPEIEYAVKNRVFGAENALAMPPFNEMSSIRYGVSFLLRVAAWLRFTLNPNFSNLQEFSQKREDRLFPRRYYRCCLSVIWI